MMVRKRGAEAVVKDAFPVIRRWGFELTFPDLITALNLCAGIAAIFSAIKGELLAAGVLIVAGMAFDYFDGRIARYYRQAHDFGREMDSLADLTTFGVAPSVLLLFLYPTSDLVLAGVSLYAVAVAFRLARFNLQHEKGFVGMPAPFAAFILLGTAVPAALLGLHAIIPALVLFGLALLMVSAVKFPHV